jgi:hypothetical protein
MSQRSSHRVVVLASLAWQRRASVAWQVVHALRGLEQLGIDFCFVCPLEGSASSPADVETATAAIDRLFKRFSFPAKWVFLTDARNLHGVGPQAAHLGDWLTDSAGVLRLDSQAANLPGNRLPTVDVTSMRPLVCTELWRKFISRHRPVYHYRGPGDWLADANPSVLAATPRIEWITDRLDGANAGQVPDGPIAVLRGLGVRTRDESQIGSDVDWYREFISSASGEVRGPGDESTAFDDMARSACYLAAGRPVIAPLEAVAPWAGAAGLLGYRTRDEMLLRMAEVDANYVHHSQAALDIANRWFDADQVLRELWLRLVSNQVHAPAEPSRSGDPAEMKSTAEEINSAPAIAASSSPDQNPSPLEISPSVYIPNGMTLLITCSGDDDTGGGLFAITESGLEEIDCLSSMGLCLFNAPDGSERLARGLREEVSGSGELIVYDRHGVEHYYRMDAVTNFHDVGWDGKRFVIVSTGNNSIVWMSPSGQIERTFQAPGEPADSWHLNCLLQVGDRLIASAFGRFPHHRGWHGRGARPDGILFDIETGKDLVTGLHTPHTQRIDGNDLLVCCSSLHEVVRISLHDLSVKSRLRLEGWTRGMVVTDNFLLVGESGHRRASGRPLACVCVVNKTDSRVVTRVQVPCREIYDLLLVPDALVHGVRRGFQTSYTRTSETDQHMLFRTTGVRPPLIWGTGDPLPADQCRVQITADYPPTLVAGREARVDMSIKNQGGVMLYATKPNPLFASYKWFDRVNRTPIQATEGIRTPLVRGIPPGKTERVELRVMPPPLAGEYLLRLTLVQENVAWFDSLHPANARDFAVVVHADEESVRFARRLAEQAGPRNGHTQS